MKKEYEIATALIIAIILFGCTSQSAPETDGTATESLQVYNEANASAFIQQKDIALISGLETGLMEVPNPLSGDNPVHKLVARSMPGPGESFKDPTFGTDLTRVTKNLGIRHEYSRFDPFNSDKTMILLTVPATGEWKLYRTTSNPYDQETSFIRNIALDEIRWDPQSPDLMWGLRDFSIIVMNVSSGTETVVKDFSKDQTIGPIINAEPDLYHITMNNEGESSLDKRFWAFIIQGTKEEYRPRYIFTWDAQQNKVLGVYKIAVAESSIDWVGMSPKGNFVLIGGDDTDKGNIIGMMMADKELKNFHKLDYATAHSDVGIDSQGREVIVMQNTRTDYIDMIPIDWNTKSIDEVGGSYAGTGRVPLIKLFYDSESLYGLNSGVHISCNAPGYCVVSTNIEPNTAEQNWLDRNIVLVKLDSVQPKTFYLAKSYGTTGDYWEETQATMTNDGSRVVWATNWNQGVGKENAGSIFVMQLDLK